jgi:hypothetical protein
MKKKAYSASLQTVIAKLELMFEVFNKHFFTGQLETPVITVSPDVTRGAYGWCTSWKAWRSGEMDGFYEINLCAEYLSRSFEEICATLLHEMVHLKNLQDKVQDCSRGGLYHNARFKEAAEKHGLLVEKHFKYGWCITRVGMDATEWLKTAFPNEQGFTLQREKKAKTKKRVGRAVL